MGKTGKLPYTVPDWRVWKVEDAPELVKLRDRLATKGLKDPWLRYYRCDLCEEGMRIPNRTCCSTKVMQAFDWFATSAIWNEVWRHQPSVAKMPLPKLIFKGFGWGAAAFVVAVTLEKLFWKEDDHGGH